MYLSREYILPKSDSVTICYCLLSVDDCRSLQYIHRYKVKHDVELNMQQTASHSLELYDSKKYGTNTFNMIFMYAICDDYTELWFNVYKINRQINIQLHTIKKLPENHY